MARGLVLTAALAVLFAAAPARARAAWFGYNDNAVVQGQFAPDRDAALLEKAAAGSARIDVDWSWVEQQQGSLDLSMYDPIYNAMLARGIHPLLSLMGSPRWAWPPLVLCFPVSQCHVAPDPSKDAAWANFAGAVARLFPQAAAIEIWNEPNLDAFFRPSPDPARYTDLLRLAHDAIKGVAPGMPVLGGSLAPVLSEQHGGGEISLRAFLRGMYGAGALGHMDGLSIHPYPNGRLHGGTFEAIDAAIEERDAAGDRVPLWLTELGVSSSGAGSAELSQARALGDLVPRLLRRPEVEGVYVHSLADTTAVPLTAEDGYGILRNDGQPKLAFCAIVRALRGTSSCWAPPPTPAMVARWDAMEQLQAAAEAALAYRRTTGSYAALTSTDLNAIQPALSAEPAALDAPPGPTADPTRIAVLTAPQLPDGIRLCNASRETRSYCMTIQPGGPWRFTAAEGSIAIAVAATDAGTAEHW